MKVNPKDPIVKFAILEEHKFICFYEGERLNLFNCTIDHIIPESYENKPDVLLKYIENYDGEFDVNNLDNLVPAAFDANVSKGDKAYDVNTILHYIEQAKSKAPKILKRIEKLKKYKNIEKTLAIISNYIFTSDNPKEEISKVIEFLSNEREPFEKRRQVLDNHFVRSSSSVSIDAYLPSSFEKQGCCLLLFRSLFVSDCMITLDHMQIVQQLFKGLYTKSNFENRGFIAYKSPYSPNIYYVQIGNNRFTLLENEVQELCEIVDDFATLYIERYKSLEKQYGTVVFKEINPINFSVKMFEIKRGLWKKLIQFTWEFDYSKGNSEWHIFSATNGTIVVYPGNTILSRFFPTKSKDFTYESFMHSDDNVLVLWEPGSSSSKEKVWDCKEAYYWLTQKFIPYVVYYHEILNKNLGWFEKIPTYEQFLDQFDINRYISFSNLKPPRKEMDEVSQLSELQDAVGRMQYFFYTPRNIYITQEEAKTTYEALALLILHTTLPDYAYGYIGGKLSCMNRSQDGVYKFLKNKISNINQDEYNEMTIDLACRCMLEIMKYSSELLINKAILSELKNFLSPVWEKYSLESYIQRMKRE
ncbi:HNH endonuclease signature motif containing protein [Paenibacillus jamilae]